jgi:hypothetical protein
MVLTRAEGKVALTHVLKNVLKLEDDNPLFRALSKDKLLDISDVLILPFEDIEKLTYIDDQEMNAILSGAIHLPSISSSHTAFTAEIKENLLETIGPVSLTRT